MEVLLVLEGICKTPVAGVTLLGLTDLSVAVTVFSFATSLTLHLALVCSAVPGSANGHQVDVVGGWIPGFAHIAAIDLLNRGTFQINNIQLAALVIVRNISVLSIVAASTASETSVLAVVGLVAILVVGVLVGAGLVGLHELIAVQTAAAAAVAIVNWQWLETHGTIDHNAVVP